MLPRMRENRRRTLRRRSGLQRDVRTRPYLSTTWTHTERGHLQTYHFWQPRRHVKFICIYVNVSIRHAMIASSNLSSMNPLNNHFRNWLKFKSVHLITETNRSCPTHTNKFRVPSGVLLNNFRNPREWRHIKSPKTFVRLRSAKWN